MKEISPPFSLFDFFALLFPGVIGLVGIYMFFNPSLSIKGHEDAFSNAIIGELSGDLAVVMIIVLSGYLFGLVLGAFSELLIDRPGNKIFGSHISKDINHHNVHKALKITYGEDVFQQSNRRTFLMVEAVVGKELTETSANARKFIALATMFQSLSLALLIIGIAMITAGINKQIFVGETIKFISTILIILILIVVLLWSYWRYKRMWSQTIFMSFVALVGTKAESNETSQPIKT